MVLKIQKIISSRTYAVDPAGDRIMPIRIRPDLVVRFCDIPHDLTRAEADKIIGVIMALATPAKDPS